MGPGSREDFYSNLYLGLFNEAMAEGGAPSGAAAARTKARMYMAAAAASPYGLKSNDYMWSLAKVHLKERPWN